VSVYGCECVCESVSVYMCRCCEFVCVRVCMIVCGRSMCECM
jgi:hypothetical protein